jgi:hypothetical protein
MDESVEPANSFQTSARKPRKSIWFTIPGRAARSGNDAA